MELSDHAKYDCLSYSWGEEGVEQNRPLKIRGESSNSTQTIMVTRSVESALEQFRHNGYTNPLWIDQICINQGDDGEKSNQIQMMAKIYGMSSVVLVWLGSKSGHSDEAMGYLRELVETFENHGKPEGYAYQSKKAQATHELLKRTWFERVWTLQEAANARNCKILCGTEMIDYQVFEKLYLGCQGEKGKEWREILECIATSSPTPTRTDDRPILAHILTIAKLKEIREREQMGDKDAISAGSALMLFNRLRSCKTQNARDKIFSMYGNLPQNVKKTVGSPEYKLPVEDLYHRVATSQICEMGNTMYLAAAGTYRRNLSLPSWVPDYTYPETHYSFAVLDEDCFHTTGQYLFQAAGREEAVVQITDDHRRLKLAGRILGNVREMAQPFKFSSYGNRDPAPRLNRQLKELRQYIDDCQNMIKSLTLDYTELDPSTVLRLTLTCGMKVRNGGPSFGGVFVSAVPTDIDKRFEAFEKFVSAGDRMTGGPVVDAQVLPDRDLGNGRVKEGGLQLTLHNITPTAAMNNMKAFYENREEGLSVLEPFGAACSGRAFFVTNDNHMGLAPGETRLEDQVCIIHGCRVPFIIRPIELRKIDGEKIKRKIYVLVGECYVYGYMDGEATRDDKAKVENINLI